MKIIHFFKKTATFWVILIAAVTLPWLAVFSFLTLPNFSDEIKRNATHEQWEGDHSVYYSLKSVMLSYFTPYAIDIVSMVEEIDDSTSGFPDWRKLTNRDGVVDAFNVNFTAETFESANGFAPPHHCWRAIA